MLRFIAVFIFVLLANLATAQPLTVEISPKAKAIKLLEGWQMLASEHIDNTEQALYEADWQPLNHQDLLSSFVRPNFFWFRLRLQNDSDVDLLRWLDLGSTRIQSVHFYLLDENQQMVKQTQAGTLIAQQQHEIPSAIARLFELTVPAHQYRDVYIRVKTSTEVTIEPILWQPESFREYEARQNVMFLVPIAIILTVGTILLIFGFATKDPLTLLAGFWVTTYSAYESCFIGYIHYYLAPSGSHLISVLPLFFGLSAVVITFVLLHIALRLDRSPFWRKLSLSLIAYYTFLALYSLVDLYTSIYLSHYTVVIAAFSQPIILLLNWKHRQKNSAFFLVAAVVFYVILVTRTLFIIHVVDESIIYTPILWHTVLAIYLISLILGFHKRASANHQRQLQAQRTLIDVQSEQQKRLENAVKMRTEELQHSLIELKEANQSKDEFLARVSHDLRSPLTSILGFAELIRAQESTATADKANIIMNSGKRLLSLIDDLIEFSSNKKSKQTLYPSATYSQSFFTSIADESEILAQANNNRFHLNVCPQLPKVMFIDSRRVYQILINLISNACKFTQNGDITLKVSSAAINETQHRLIITVKDTGTGISETQLPYIFDPFAKFQQNQHSQGLGLGLAIVNQWVQRMQGSITVNSTVGEGSEFIVHLPIEEVDETAVELNSIPANDEHIAMDGKQRLVWVVEDTPYIQALITQALLQWNFTVQCFDDLSAVNQALQAGTVKPPALVLTDFHLPDGDGCAVAHQIKQQWSATPIILLSAGLIGSSCLQDNLFFSTFYKPINFTLLAKSIAQALELELYDNHSSAITAEPIAFPCVANQCTSDEDLLVLNELVDINAISDIITWCERQVELSPHCAEFYHQIREAAFSADIQKIRQLISLLPPQP